jgi:hypothetical protein
MLACCSAERYFLKAGLLSGNIGYWYYLFRKFRVRVWRKMLLAEGLFTEYGMSA